MSRSIHLGLLLNLFWLVGCTSTEQTNTQLYYGLAEQRLQVVEINSGTGDIKRELSLDLPDLENKGPEGLTFVANPDINQYGLFGLEESPHGGYFLVSIQASGLILVVDAPLTDEEAEQAEVELILAIPGLSRDASSLYYEDGILWVVTSKDQGLFKISTANPSVEVQTWYDLSDLPINDPEGFVIYQDVAVFADDSGDQVLRYDNFPACLANNECQETWRYEFEKKVEPSGLAWDEARQQLVLADDRGRIITMRPDGSDEKTLLRTENDWEGVTIIDKTTISKKLPLFGEYSQETIYR